MAKKNTGAKKLQCCGGVELGKKGPTKHLKRHQSPAFWPIHRKEATWAVRTSPGPHNYRSSIPILVVLRDQLKYASTGKEAKMLIKQGKFIVDGKPQLDERFPVGLMDVISIPQMNENYRVLPDHGGKLKLLPISEDESKFKLCQIINKKSLKNGKTQLNLHDGRNIILASTSDNYNVNDVIKVKIPEQEIIDHIDFKEMMQSIITGGRSQGKRGMIIGFGPEPGWKKTATIRTPEGDDIRTLAQYVFVVGQNEPILTLDEAEA